MIVYPISVVRFRRFSLTVHLPHIISSKSVNSTSFISTIDLKHQPSFRNIIIINRTEKSERRKWVSPLLRPSRRTISNLFNIFYEKKRKPELWNQCKIGQTHINSNQATPTTNIIDHAFDCYIDHPIVVVGCVDFGIRRPYSNFINADVNHPIICRSIVPTRRRPSRQCLEQI